MKQYFKVFYRVVISRVMEDLTSNTGVPVSDNMKMSKYYHSWNLKHWIKFTFILQYNHNVVFQNKLKSLKVAKWRKDEWRMIKYECRMMKDEWWLMKDEDFKLLKGFALGRTNGQTFAIVESLSWLKKFNFRGWALMWIL